MPLTLSITLLQIKQGANRQKQNFAVLFKIANQQLKIDELYKKSTTSFDHLNFQPSQAKNMKGLIKIFEIDSQGHQIIVGVGSINFQFSSQHGTSDIETIVNQFKIKIHINYQYKCQQQTNSMKRVYSHQNLQQENGNQSPSRFTKNKNIQYDGQQTYCIGQSQSYISRLTENSLSRCSQFSEEIRLNEQILIGQLLIEERRQNKLLEQKVQTQSIKIFQLKKAFKQKNQLIKMYIQNFIKFIKQLQTNFLGQYIFQLKEKTHQLSIKYKSSQFFKQNFRTFLDFMAKQIQEQGKDYCFTNNKNSYSCSKAEDEQSFSSDQTKVMELDLQNKSLASELEILRKQLQEMDKILEDKNNYIKDLEQEKIKLEEDIEAVCKMNDFLDQKDKKNQQCLINKDAKIQQLNQVIEQNNLDLDTLEINSNQLQSKIDNLNLKIQQSMEQTAQLAETIEKYRKKYGDLKPIKDRAIQMEIKECLRWIDQKSKDEEFQIQDQDMENIVFSQEYVKGLNNINNLSQSDIAQFRKELIYALKKLDALQIFQQ